MRKIILDRYKDAPKMADYTVIKTEVEFLQFATENKSLIICGERLCDWALRFYQSRNIPVDEWISPTKAIIYQIPDIDIIQARVIAESLGKRYYDLPKPISAKIILETLFPEPIWNEKPSISHW